MSKWFWEAVYLFPLSRYRSLLFHSEDTSQTEGQGALYVFLVAEPRVTNGMGEMIPHSDGTLEHIVGHLVFVFALRVATISGNNAVFIHINLRIQRNVSLFAHHHIKSIF